MGPHGNCVHNSARPPEQPWPKPPHTHPSWGWPPPPKPSGAPGSPRTPTCLCPRAPAPAHARTPTVQCPGPGPLMDGHSSDRMVSRKAFQPSAPALPAAGPHPPRGPRTREASGGLWRVLDVLYLDVYLDPLDAQWGSAAGLARGSQGDTKHSHNNKNKSKRCVVATTTITTASLQFVLWSIFYSFPLYPAVSGCIRL